MERDATALMAMSSERFSYKRAALKREMFSMSAVATIQQQKRSYLRTAEIEDRRHKMKVIERKGGQGNDRKDKHPIAGVAAPGYLVL